MAVSGKSIQAQLSELRQQPLDDLLLTDRHAVQTLLERAHRKPPSPAQLKTLRERVRRSQATVSRRLGEKLSTDVDAALPIAAEAERLREAIGAHPVTIVCGATGSGKTTQLPKLCLDVGLGVRGTIGHTQPRRLAARSVADRIATEVGARLGEQVGYKVRFGDRTGPDCRIKLMTDGILLQELKSDRWLHRYDALIIDEAHERSLNIDFLLGYLKTVLDKRDDLKLIVTSATIDPAKFSRFFDDAPVVEVGGRGFPIDVRFEPGDDTRLDESVGQAVMNLLRDPQHEKGDILVFLPGERDIRECSSWLTQNGSGRLAEVLPLFARLNDKRQRRIWSPGKKRRVILATNIAETSLTVPRIHYVVDSGLARIGRYSYRSKMQHLPIEKISRASADQRAGRCGRLGPGVCVRLYGEEDYAARPEFTEPEILRTSLASVILQMLDLRLGRVDAFDFVDAPDERFVKDGYRLLDELGALDSHGRVSKTGRRMARLPLDPRLGRFLVAASELGCLEEALIVASGLSVADPLERAPADGQSTARSTLVDTRSDFVTLINVWRAFHEIEGREAERRRWCSKHHVARQRLEEWRDVQRQLRSMVSGQRLRRNDKPASYAALHRAFLHGFASHIGERMEGNSFRGARNRSFALFPGSALAKRPPPWVVAAELVETSRVFGRQAAAVKPGWVRDAAAHLVRCDYSDPRWSHKRGQVTAIELAKVFGLTLGKGRRVNYGPINPVAAREVFIEHVLVAPDKVYGFDFARHNARLRAEVQDQSTRLRKLLASDDVQRGFFRARLPVGVCDMKSLCDWLDEDDSRGESLCLSRDKAGWNERAQSAWYPGSLSVDGNELELVYRFEPGTEADGVTLRLPVALARHVSAAQTSWLVPGYLEEKVVASLRALPKAQRKIFAPVPDAARRFVAWAIDGDLPGGGESLTAALTRFAREEFRSAVPADAWQGTRLDDWLHLRIELLDGEGHVLAAGRDLDQLKARFARAADADLVRDERWFRDGLHDWSVGDLPDTVDVTQGEVTISGCPALVDGGNEVKLRIFPDMCAAQDAHRGGVVRLAFFDLQDKRRYLRKNLPDANRLSLLYLQLGDFESLLDDLVLAAIEHGFTDGPESVPRSESAYRDWLSGVRKGLIAASQELGGLILEVLSARQSTVTALEDSSERLPDEVRADMHSQLAALFAPGFVRTTPRERLACYPRYLNALSRRVARWGEGRGENAEQSAQVRRHWQRYLEHAEDGGQALERYRWLIEELRVSVFAQDLGTREPVSGKRLDKAWRECTSSGP